MNVRCCRRLILVATTLLTCLALTLPQTAAQQNVAPPPEAAEPQWIWSPAHGKDLVPAGTCYFRRTLVLHGGERGDVQVACDDAYELFVNGRQIGSGDDWRRMTTFDLQPHLVRGRNVLAIKATNTTGNSAGLVVRIKLVGQTGGAMAEVSDDQWKTSLKKAAGWESVEFDDSQWIPAHGFGPFGPTAPWSNQVAGDGGGAGRFILPAEFRVEQVVSAEQTGSLTTMTFNEWGDIIAAREGGPLISIVDEDRDGLVETVSTCSESVKNCQGILALNGNLFVIGEGPEGTGFYRIANQDAQQADPTPTMLIEFDAGMGEHGPHAPVLGPDGLIYIMVGNHAQTRQEPSADSPHHHFYEGDLIQPRYEDANGHAVGIKAPGGTVLRTNTEGDFVQLYAGGLRNAYDLAFNRQGDLFTFDSDMEWDIGQPWYRPTRINHLVAGGEYGWRSGWAVWPEYYIDSLPATLDTGRGSPTGVEFYNHYRFPVRYHNAMFACDWSQGRILAVKLKPSGGTYEAQAEVFLEGRPLNATDVAVGPDGWLYFCTGGRGTQGGIYRVVWTGKVPPRPKLQGVLEAIRQPQLHSAWARQQVAAVQQAVGANWDKHLVTIVENSAWSVGDRMRALDLMQLVGPFPSTTMLLRVSRESHAELRAKAAGLLGIHTSQAGGERLVEMLTDPDAAVRRAACEALVRGGYQPQPEPLLRLLADPYPYVAWSARRTLETLPAAQWQETVLASNNHRVFLMGATALLVMEPDQECIDTIITRASALMRGYMKDEDFVDLLRVLQLALLQGGLTRDNVPDLCAQLAEEYPAAEPPDRPGRINRELVRLLVYLDEPSVIPRFLNTLSASVPNEEKVHVALHARFLDKGWTSPQKLALVQFYEQARSLPGGHSYSGYIDNACRDFIASFDELQRELVLADARRLPTAALFVLASLSEHPGDAVIRRLIELDGELQGSDDPAVVRLATGVMAVLGRSADERAMAHLRQAYESRPELRQELAMGLAQSPGGDNWPVLIRSLAIVEGAAAREVLTQLARVDQQPEDPEPLRQVILAGLKLQEKGAPLAVKLLAQWTGENVHQPKDSWTDALAAWQEWFIEQYPDEPAPMLPVDPPGAQWSHGELLGYLSGEQAASADPRRGAEVFVRAQCAKCHRHGNIGEPVGPDLSTVGQRFQRKEILESIVFPSQVISDQYATKTVTTTDGLSFTGMIAPVGDDAIVVLEANGEKTTIDKSDVDQMLPAARSAMPDGLLNTLTLEQIADLFAYLAASNSADVLSRQPGSRRR